MSRFSPIRVLSVDDHQMIRNGIAFAIAQQRDMELVGEAENGLEAVAAFRRLQPDVTLMDIRMPHMSGIDATEAIRKEFPNARIIALTTYSGDIQASRALRVGVSGYLLKAMLAAELVDTIRRVHAGQRRIEPEVALDLAEHLRGDDLSVRERQVLQGVASGCSNKIVADNLRITEDTIKGHMKNILAKLQANDRTHAVMIALRRGYLEW